MRALNSAYASLELSFPRPFFPGGGLDSLSLLHDRSTSANAPETILSKKAQIKMMKLYPATTKRERGRQRVKPRAQCKTHREPQFDLGSETAGLAQPGSRFPSQAR